MCLMQHTKGYHLGTGSQIVFDTGLFFDWLSKLFHLQALKVLTRRG